MSAMTVTEALPTPIEPRAPDLLSVISRAAADPAVDVLKMESLLRLQREIMADHAKAEFNEAYTRLTGRIPPVEKNGKITLGVKGEVSFATWEDINAIIQPILREENFGLTYSSRQDGDIIVVIGTLVHMHGHSITAEAGGPPDTGPGRNQLQAIGSTITYLKRYVTEMLLNIVRKGQDDDGTGGPPQLRRGRAPQGFRPQRGGTAADYDIPVLTRVQFDKAAPGTRYRMEAGGRVYEKPQSKEGEQDHG